MEQKRIQWLSSIEEKQWIDNSANIAADTANGKPNLTVTGDRYQLLEGFGGCFNELGYASLKHLTDEERAKRPEHLGWEQNAMLTIDKESGSVTRNPEFYVMKHFSHFTSPNDRRVGLQGPWAGNAVAFKKPDGSHVVIVTNPFKDQRDLRLAIGGARLDIQLEPESFHTIVVPIG